MFNDNKNIKNYFVYQYEHLDDLGAILKPNELYNNLIFIDSQDHERTVVEAVEEVANLFRINGWEGDGEIGVIWVPPFIKIGFSEDTWGGYLWHVKQSNNGTSYIASPIPLKNTRLDNTKNETIYTNDYRNMEPINIIQDISEGFLERLDNEKKDFENEYKKISTEIDDISTNISNKLLAYTQCDLIAQLSDYLNDCYLQLLREVLDNGNKSKIKLRKSSVPIDLSRHDHSDWEIKDESKAWLSISMFITDIWRAYKFEPFKEKYDRLTKSLDFTANKDVYDHLLKHVVIRNCIQHHDWQLDASSLKSLGISSINIKTDKESIEIKKNRLIILTKEEIDMLFVQLTAFANSLNIHVDSRVVSRYYRPKDGGDYLVVGR